MHIKSYRIYVFSNIFSFFWKILLKYSFIHDCWPWLGADICTTNYYETLKCWYCVYVLRTIV
jgi:hypothetical protein